MTSGTAEAPMGHGGDATSARGTPGAELMRFVTAHRLVLLVGLIAALVAHGLMIVAPSLSVDEELYLPVDRTAGFLEQGRPGITAFKSLLVRTIPIPFFWPLVAVALLYLTGIGWAFFLAHAIGRPLRPIGVLLFLVVFATLPVQAYYLMWNTTNVEITIGLLFALGGAWFSWLWVHEGREPAAFGTAIALAFIAAITYQSLGFVVLAGALLAQLARLLTGMEPGAERRTVRSTFLLLIPGAIAIALGGLVTAATVKDGSYVAGLFRWGSDAVGSIVEGLVRDIGAYAVGLGFVGGWVLIPTLIAGVVVLAFAVRRGLRGGGWFAVLLLGLLVLAPFANSVAIGALAPNRALQALPLVAAGIWLIAVELLPARREVVGALGIFAFALWIWQAGVTNRLYLVEQTTYEIDRAIASRIAERLVDQGWDGRSIPLVSVGMRPLTLVEDLADDESFGYPFFNLIDDGARATAFLQDLGHDVRYATADERAIGLRRAEGMPVWPAAGSVAYVEGIAVVKFAEP